MGHVCKTKAIIIILLLCILAFGHPSHECENRLRSKVAAIIIVMSEKKTNSRFSRGGVDLLLHRTTAAVHVRSVRSIKNYPSRNILFSSFNNRVRPSVVQYTAGKENTITDRKRIKITTDRNNSSCSRLIRTHFFRCKHITYTICIRASKNLIDSRFVIVFSDH